MMRCKGNDIAAAGMAKAKTATKQPRRAQSHCKCNYLCDLAPVMLSDSGSMCKNRRETGANAMSGRHAAPAGSSARNGARSPFKIMIIRHAEKHQHGSHGLGVTEDG